MREVVLDTETTGRDPDDGDRILEIGCVELINHVQTGRVFHRLINPEYTVSDGALAVHGLSNERLRSQPVFAEIVAELLDFLEDSPLVIHNAAFDMGFLNMELRRLALAPLPDARAIDTLAIARRRFPGAPASLDALCRRFGVDNTGRTLHGALLDAQLLAEVYLELMGGRQPGLLLAMGQGGVAPAGALGPNAGGPSAVGPSAVGPSGIGAGAVGARAAARGEPAVTALAAGAVAPGVASGPLPRPLREPRPHAASADELAAHRALLGQLKDPLWVRLLPAAATDDATAAAPARVAGG